MAVKIHRQILTEDDANEVWDPVRIGAAIGFLMMNGLALYSVVWQGMEYDIQAFGVANGTYLGSTGLALWASSHQKDEAK